MVKLNIKKINQWGGALNGMLEFMKEELEPVLLEAGEDPPGILVSTCPDWDHCEGWDENGKAIHGPGCRVKPYMDVFDGEKD